MKLSFVLIFLLAGCSSESLTVKLDAEPTVESTDTGSVPDTGHEGVDAASDSQPDAVEIPDYPPCFLPGSCVPANPNLPPVPRIR